MDDWVRGGQDASPVRTSAAAPTERLKTQQSYSDPTLQAFEKKGGVKKKKTNIHERFEENFFPLLPNTKHPPSHSEDTATVHDDCYEMGFIGPVAVWSVYWQQFGVWRQEKSSSCLLI